MIFMCHGTFFLRKISFPQVKRDEIMKKIDNLQTNKVTQSTDKTY